MPSMFPGEVTLLLVDTQITNLYNWVYLFPSGFEDPSETSHFSSLAVTCPATCLVEIRAA